MSADPFVAEIVGMQRAAMREIAEIVRDGAVEMVNTLIVLHENIGSGTVSLAELRALADSINRLSLPGAKP